MLNFGLVVMLDVILSKTNSRSEAATGCTRVECTYFHIADGCEILPALLDQVKGAVELGPIVVLDLNMWLYTTLRLERQATDMTTERLFRCVDLLMCLFCLSELFPARWRG